jgi:hypothetical protein
MNEYERDSRPRVNNKTATLDKPKPKGPFEQTVDDLLKVGLTVAHQKFGVGKVIAREGRGEDMILTIRFGSGTKKVMVKYAALEILG